MVNRRFGEMIGRRQLRGRRAADLVAVFLFFRLMVAAVTRGSNGTGVPVGGGGFVTVTPETASQPKSSAVSSASRSTETVYSFNPGRFEASTGSACGTTIPG